MSENQTEHKPRERNYRQQVRTGGLLDSLASLKKSGALSPRTPQGATQHQAQQSPENPSPSASIGNSGSDRDSISSPEHGQLERRSSIQEKKNTMGSSFLELKNKARGFTASLTREGGTPRRTSIDNGPSAPTAAVAPAPPSSSSGSPNVTPEFGRRATLVPRAAFFDFETLYPQRKKDYAWAYREIFKLDANEVVLKKPSKHVTATPSLTSIAQLGMTSQEDEKTLKKAVPRWVKDCHHFYTQKTWSVLAIAPPPHTIIPDFSSLPLQHYEFLVSPVNPRDSLPFTVEEITVDPIEPHHLQSAASNDDDPPDFVFTANNVSTITLPVLEDRSYQEPKPISVRKISVTVNSLSFVVGSFEPLFGILALYDFSKKKRISENFYFQLNQPEIQGWIKDFYPSTNEISNCSTAVFNISKPSSDISLVLRIEKVLQSDIETVSDPYIKPNNVKEKEREKLKKNIQEISSRIGNFRQALGWGFIPLFTDSNTLDKKGRLQLFQTGEATLSPIYKFKGVDSNDAFFLETASETKVTTSRKAKLMPGGLNVTIEDVTDSLSPAYDPSLHNRNETLQSKEIQEFPTRTILQPHFSFVNNMYIYLDYLNFSSRSGAKNLSVNIQIFSDDSLKSKPLPLIFGRSHEELFVTSFWSSVTYHTKTPSFYDEIKIRLPILSPNHHILFTFYQVNVQQSKSSTQILGYSWLPFFDREKTIISDEISLPVYSELVAGYLNGDKSKAFEGGKKLLKLRVHVESSVYAPDAPLHEYFTSLPQPSKEAIKNLVRVSPSQLAKFAPILLTQLLNLISENRDESQQAFLTLLQLLQTIHTASADSVDTLEGYVAYVYKEKFKKKKPLFTLLAKNLISQMRSTNKERVEKIAKYSWFFFQLIFKSLALLLADKKLLNSAEARNKPPRVEFSFIEDLETLVGLVTSEINARHKSGFNIAKELNKSLAWFLTSLFRLLDRGVVCQLIDSSIHKICYTSNAALIEFKFDFLSILSSYYQFVPLNIPIEHQEIHRISDLLEEWSEKHFLIGIALRQIDNYMVTNESNVRHKVIHFLQNMLFRFDQDPRFQKRQAKSMIAEMFFPLVVTVSNHLDGIKGKDLTFLEKRIVLSSFLWVLRSVPPSLLSQWWRNGILGTAPILETLQYAVGIFEVLENHLAWSEKMETSEKHQGTEQAKNLLEKIYTDKGITESRSARYRGAMKSLRDAKTRRESEAPEPASMNGSTNSNSTSTSSINSPSNGGTASDRSPTIGRSNLRSPKYGTLRSKDEFHRTGSVNSGFLLSLESNVCTQAAITCVVVAESYVQYFLGTQDSLPQDAHPELELVFKLLVSVLQHKQSYTALFRTFEFLKKITNWVFDPPQTVLRDRVAVLNSALLHSVHLSDLISEAIRFSNSQNQDLRIAASSFLYVLLCDNWKFDHTLSKVSIFLTNSISKLVGSGIKDDNVIKSSLKTLLLYTKLKAVINDKMEPTFAAELEKLVKGLLDLLDHTMKMNVFLHDPETMADLRFNISKSCFNSPDLRFTWLSSLATFHEQEHNWAEATMCHLHIAVLATEYLNIIDPHNLEVPSGGATAFLGFSENVRSETAIQQVLKDAPELADSQNTPRKTANIPQSVNLTVEMFWNTLEKLISMSQAADYYEFAIKVYQIMIPLLEKKHDFAKLVVAHDAISKLYQKVIESDAKEQRILGTYYRVGFYGSQFDESNGIEYIYKEPKLTRLGEIKSRLLSIYENQVGGSDKLKIISDSNIVDSAKLEPDFGYIQLTTVNPHLPPDALLERPTFFEKNINLQQFIFQTPFTLTGKVHADDIKDQYKRKTIITCEYPFPAMTRRIKVVKKQEIILEPIENSLDNIQERNAELRQAMQFQVYKLEIILHGNILGGVNVGPRRIAEDFLAKDQVSKYDPSHVKKLQAAFREFLMLNASALEVVKKTLTVKQKELYTELTKGFAKFREFLEELL